jgi:branched-chain amino acid transport system permease protein
VDAEVFVYYVAYFGMLLITAFATDHLLGFAKIPAFVNRIPVLIGAFTISAVSLRIIFPIAASAGLQMLDWGSEQGWVYNNQANVEAVNGLIATNPALGIGLILFTFAAAFILGGLGGWLLARVTLGLEPILILMATLAFTDVGCVFGRNITWLAGGTLGVTAPDPLAFAPGNQQAIWAAIALTIAALVYMLLGLLESSPWGRLVEAVGENPVGAASMGTDIVRVRGIVVFYASGVMALAGTLFSFYSAYVIEASYHNWPWLFYPLIAMMIGGVGNKRGTVLGIAFILIVVRALVELRFSVQSLVFFPVSYLDSIVIAFIMLAALYIHPRMMPRKRRRPIKGIAADAS